MSYLVEVTARGVTTDSRTVAEVFEKEHKNVLQNIDAILEKRPDLCGLNFQPTSAEVAGPRGGARTVRAFSMDRDGFTLLAMGFTGEKALDWKIAYIEAFNRMEAELRERAEEERNTRCGTMEHMADYAPAITMIREVRQVFGRSMARRMWPRLGLPTLTDHPASAEAEEGFAPPESIAAWLRERTRPEPSVSEAAGVLYSSYTAYCEVEGYSPDNQTRFGRALGRMGYFGRQDGSGRVRRYGLALLA